MLPGNLFMLRATGRSGKAGGESTIPLGYRLGPNGEVKLLFRAVMSRRAFRASQRRRSPSPRRWARSGHGEETQTETLSSYSLPRYLTLRRADSGSGTAQKGSASHRTRFVSAFASRGGPGEGRDLLCLHAETLD